MNLNLSIVAVNYSSTNILQKFIEQNCFANEIIIIDLANINLLENKNVIVKKATICTYKNIFLETIQLVKNDWFLFVPTTYFFSNDLVTEIANALNDKSTNAFYIKKDFLFLYEVKKFGTIEKEKTLCLFKKDTYLDVTNYKTATLNNKITNKSYTTFDDYNSNLSIIKAIEAEELFEVKTKPTFYNFIIKPFTFFVKHYFFKGEILNGKNGFMLTYIHTFAYIKKQVILWLKYKNME